MIMADIIVSLHPEKSDTAIGQWLLIYLLQRNIFLCSIQQNGIFI